MPDYRLYTCPVCGRAFTQEDDVVVCPQCGAPHHRSCWKAAGGCACRASHGTPEQWRPPLFRGDDDALVCGNCGTVNRAGDAVCSYCGRDLFEQPADLLDQCPELESTDFFTSSGPYSNVPPDGVIAGQPVVELASFVGPRMGYYLPRFRFIETTGKISWNWASVLFPAGWLLYRKMYAWFWLVFALSLLLAAPDGLLLWNALAPWAGGETLSLPVWVTYLSRVCFSLSLLLRLTMGNLGTKWYFRHCLRVMDRQNRRSPDAVKRSRSPRLRGGVNAAAVGVYLFLCAGGAAAAAALRFFA